MYEIKKTAIVHFNLVNFIIITIIIFIVNPARRLFLQHHITQMHVAVWLQFRSSRAP